MNVDIPDELAEALAAIARRDRLSTEELVRQALQLFVEDDETAWKEFKAGERGSDEALRLVDRLLAEDNRA